MTEFLGHLMLVALEARGLTLGSRKGKRREREKDNEVEVNNTQDAPRWPRTSLTFVLHWPWRPRASGNLTSVHVALMSNRWGTLPMYLPIEGGRTEGIY